MYIYIYIYIYIYRERERYTHIYIYITAAGVRDDGREGQDGEHLRVAHVQDPAGAVLTT